MKASHRVVLLIIGLLLPIVAHALLPFPYSANQQGMVTCLESPVVYEVYLPPLYSTNAGAPALPILYTFNPSGGGYVTEFKSVCADMNLIGVGILGSANGVADDVVMREVHAVARDIRLRVNYDPTAEFSVGFSGGGVSAHDFSRMRAQHVAGVFAMAGWLGESGGTWDPPAYQTQFRVLTNLLVARNTGETDTSAAPYYLVPDGTFLMNCGAIIKDWTMIGGHYVPNYQRKTACLSWLLNSRRPGAPTDRSNALRLATNWQARIDAGVIEPVLREVVTNLMAKPRSWFAYQAQLTLDQLLTNSPFLSLSVSNLATGEFASDMFYYYARGAALNGDLVRYRAALKVMSGVTGCYAHHAGGVYSLLTQYDYPAPSLAIGADANAPGLSLNKLNVGLDYSLQWRSNVTDAVWEGVDLIPEGTSFTLLESPPWQASTYVPCIAVGFSFIPATNLTVTHVRHYFGNKVSIWTDAGQLLAAQDIKNTSGTWADTPLAIPLRLNAGETYRVSVYTARGWWRGMNFTFPGVFTHGTIEQSYQSFTNTFPTEVITNTLPYVDLRCVEGHPACAVSDNGSGWSVRFDALPPTYGSGFYRVNTTPTPTSATAWP